MNKNVLEKIVRECVNYSEVSYKIYGNAFCGNRNTIKKYVELYNINTSHFTKKTRKFFLRSNLVKKELNEILVENSNYDTTNLKKRLYKEGLKNPKCELCGQGEIWNGKKMSLILDHKNGINNDNRIENLQIVCPNCNATLDTFSGKNVIKKEKKSVDHIKQKFRKIEISKKQRKVERPPYDILIDEIKNLGYLATGRKYGVSDNTIRKWKSFYLKHENLPPSYNG